MSSSEQWIRLARILRPQGRKGEVLADLYTDFPEQFAAGKTVWLAPDGFSEDFTAGNSSGPEPAELVAHWLPVGRNAGRVVFQFASVGSIDQAEALAGKEVVIRASERRSLDDNSFYVSDLVGVTLYDGEHPVGEIAEVLFPATPDGSRKLDDAAPLLSVTGPEAEEILVPFASAYLVEVDLPAKRLRMNLPAGLIEINRRQSGPGESDQDA